MEPPTPTSLAPSMATSEFMLQLHQRLVNEKKLAESTASAYIRTLYILNNKKAFKNLAFLTKTAEISERVVKDYAESTQRTIFATLSSVLSLMKDKAGYKKTYQFYTDKLAEKREEAADEDTSKKTEKQEQNWIEWSEVEKKTEELRQEVLKLSNKKSITKEEYDTLLHYVILSLYTYIPPRRNMDYLVMKFYRQTKKDSLDDLSKDTNWLVLQDKTIPKQFIFNIYKTAKTYGQQRIMIEDVSGTHLAEAIMLYMKFQPLLKDKTAKEVPFLVSYEGAPITIQNSITRALNRIFNKSVGSSMLRHSYLSSKYNVNEMKDDAIGMGHSLSTQRIYLKGPETPPSSPEPPCRVEVAPPPPSSPSPLPPPPSPPVVPAVLSKKRVKRSKNQTQSAQ